MLNGIERISSILYASIILKDILPSLDTAFYQAVQTLSAKIASPF
jgi:hypothetical protein